MSRMECTFEFMRSALGLPDECRITGLNYDADVGYVVVEMERKDTSKDMVEWPDNLEPIFTLREVRCEDLPAVVRLLTGHWRHEPDREWDTGKFIRFGNIV